MYDTLKIGVFLVKSSTDSMYKPTGFSTRYVSLRCDVIWGHALTADLLGDLDRQVVIYPGSPRLNKEWFLG